MIQNLINMRRIMHEVWGYRTTRAFMHELMSGYGSQFTARVYQDRDTADDLARAVNKLLGLHCYVQKYGTSYAVTIQL